MPSPFPGMDPYLEDPHFWQGVHTNLLIRICDDLQPQLYPRYVARAEERVVLGPLGESIRPDVRVYEATRPGATGGRLAVADPDVDIAAPEEIVVPDLTVPHRYITIRETTGHAVVTILELLSPWNKTGTGYREYREKQREILVSETHLVEIDLLRGGRHTVAVPKELLAPSDYRICIHRARTQRFQVVRFGVRDPIPNFRIPVRPDDEDVVLHLGQALATCYDRGSYDLSVDYTKNPEPPLPPEEAQWADALLRDRGLRK